MHRYLKKSFRLFIFIAGLLCTVPLSAQNFSGYNWYFGNSKNAIRFSRSSGTASLVTNKGIPFGTGGSAVASDQTNGNLLFYTDGTQVFDAANSLMPGGSGLQADPTQNQPVAICKIPGKKNQYYIFHRDAAGTVFLSTVDMAQFGNAVFPAPALGDVTAKNSGILALTGRSEAMIIIPHSNQQDFWLITHASSSPDYTVTLITTGGTFTNTIFTGLGLINLAANFSYHDSTGRIAVSPQEATRDVEIIHFDNTTGILGYLQSIPNTSVSSTTSQAIYDTEWSTKGEFLYISRFGEVGIQSDVLQFDFLNPLTTLASVLPQPNTIFRSYGLQMAPDSAIYHLYQATSGGPFLVGKITRSDTLAAQVGYVPIAFKSNPDFTGQQFPLFSPKDTTKLTITFTSAGTCANAPTSFYPVVTPTADSLVWDFGDGGGATDWSPVYTYKDAGTYNVKVTAYLDGDTTSATQPVTITKFDLKITLPQDTTACSCQLPFPRAKNPPPPCGQFSITAQVSGGTPTSTQWFGPAGLLTGQTTSTLKPDSAGFYYLVVTDASGCSAYAGTNIKEYGVQDQRANIWYFGKNAGIDFNPAFRNPPGPVEAITGPLDTPEGCADICDRNGQIIFSTDGQNIFDRTGTDITPLPNPPGLGGDKGSTESSLIIPVPGDETLYYIFTTQEIYGTGTFELRYSLFDLKKNNGLGSVVEYNTLLFAKSTERICSDGNWLIAHEFGNNSFRAYRITSTGIANPVITSIGSDHATTTPENGQGYMVFGSKSRIAVALSTPGVSNVIEVFDFNTTTGILTNFRTADLKDPSGQVYGVCLSSGGNKLFATLKGSPAPSKLYEFAFDSLGIPYLKKPLNAPINQELGAIQIGADGTVYVAVNGQTSLGTITPVEDTTRVSTFNLTGFPLAGGTNSELGLPNFIQIISDPLQGPGISASGFCLGSPTDFSGTGTDNIDKFQWFFGDGGGDTNAQTTHTYAAAGNYTVSLRITNRCGLDTTLVQQITIFSPPAKPDFLPPGGVPVLCNGPLTLEATPATNPDLANLTFAWSTGETTRTISVNRQANYSVTITNAAGCTSNGTELVADNKPIVELGPDLTFCQNTPQAPLDAQNPGTNYAWQINGTPTGTTQTQAVDTSVPGVFFYHVNVTDPITTCTVKDSVTFTINQSPTISNVVVTAPATCLTPTGQIAFDITAPAGTLFSYFVAGPSTISGTDQSLGTVTTTPTLATGTYGITVADQVSGCITTTTASINDIAFTVSAVPVGACDPIHIDATISAAQPSFTFRVIDAATAGVSGTGSGAGTSLSTNPLFSGTNGNNYIVEVTSSTGCVASSTPTLVKQSPTVSNIAFDLSGLCQNQNLAATSPGATSFDWSASPAASITSIDNSTAGVSIAKLNPGTWLMRVKVSDGAQCPGKDSINVVVESVTADFTQTNACSDQVTLSASPTGTFTYRWFENGSLIAGGQQIMAGLADNGATFEVDIVSALTGCVFKSPPKTVQVNGEVTVGITATPACEGSPFTLTATSNQSSAGFTWAFNGAAISGATASTLQDTLGGKYTATATVGTCSTSKDFTVLVAPVTPGLLHDDAFICPDPAALPEDNHVVLDPGPNFASYDWFLNGVTLNVTTPTYSAVDVGDYSVNLINSFGCASSDHTLVKEQCNPKIVGPSAFRPDGLNTNFFLYTFFIENSDFQVFIFNRWGEMVYQSNDRYFKWNGGFNNSSGQPLPPGTYAYVVKYKSLYSPEKGIQEKHGGVVLLR